LFVILRRRICAKSSEQILSEDDKRLVPKKTKVQNNGRNNRAYRITKLAYFKNFSLAIRTFSEEVSFLASSITISSSENH
jgi:hypothetical protein